MMSKATRGNAAVLAIGTAVPPNFIFQSDYPEYYFKSTKSEHLTELQQKLTRICIGTEIRKRHFLLTDEMLRSHPNIATYNEGSLDARNLLSGVQELAVEAADVALAEWGQPRSKITHLVFHTATGSVNLPGPDYHLANLLGLSNKVNRCMFFHSGCYAGGTLLRIAKDIAENNPGARVLAVCSESTVSFSRGPSAACMDALVAQALFGDGAGAIIVGSDPDFSVERPLYEIVSASQSFIPDTADTLGGSVTEAGFIVFLSRTVPFHVANSLRQCVSEAFAPLGITDLNSVFWIVHPGGRKILDEIESELKLDKDKMMPTRDVLAEYGNVMSAGVFFVMEEMRKRSAKGEKCTTGEGAEFGVLLGFGPGLTIETLVLRAFQT